METLQWNILFERKAILIPPLMVLKNQNLYRSNRQWSKKICRRLQNRQKRFERLIYKGLDTKSAVLYQKLRRLLRERYKKIFI